MSVASDGRRALERFRSERPALVILDLMLPEISGLDVCRTIRAESDVPIIMVTAKDSEADKVTGLELGADDYVTKPFSCRELLARVKAVIRRRTPQLDDEVIEVTTVWSVAGLLPHDAGLLRTRPFRAPHHTISVSGLIGGGSPPHPGEVTLAHHGVLVCDELPEFGRDPLGFLTSCAREYGDFAPARFGERSHVGGRIGRRLLRHRLVHV